MDIPYKSKVDQLGAVAANMYRCKLIDIKDVQRKAFQSQELETQAQFVFESTLYCHPDDPSKPLRFFHAVRKSYGSDNSNLTKLLDKMLGRRLTEAQWRAFDIMTLIGSEYDVYVDYKVAGDKSYNNVLFVNSVAGVPVQQPTATAQAMAAQPMAKAPVARTPVAANTGIAPSSSDADFDPFA